MILMILSMKLQSNYTCFLPGKLQERPREAAKIPSPEAIVQPSQKKIFNLDLKTDWK